MTRTIALNACAQANTLPAPVKPVRGDGALGQQASSLPQRPEPAACLLSQCLERLKAAGQSLLSSSEVKRMKTDCQNEASNKFR